MLSKRQYSTRWSLAMIIYADYHRKNRPRLLDLPHRVTINRGPCKVRFFAPAFPMQMWRIQHQTHAVYLSAARGSSHCLHAILSVCKVRLSHYCVVLYGKIIQTMDGCKLHCNMNELFWIILQKPKRQHANTLNALLLLSTEQKIQ